MFDNPFFFFARDFASKLVQGENCVTCLVPFWRHKADQIRLDNPEIIADPLRRATDSARETRGVRIHRFLTNAGPIHLAVK